MGTIMGVVPAVAPIFGGVHRAPSAGASTFAVMILFGLALAAVVACACRDDRRRSERADLLRAILRGFKLAARPSGLPGLRGLSVLTYGGLFAFISGSSFVLQEIYGLDELSYAFSFTFVVVGFMAGTILAQHLVGRRGLDGTIRLGVMRPRARRRSPCWRWWRQAFPHPSPSPRPMAIYGIGVGLTMPQSMASALMPFPDRAGAASSLLGICQMTFAAIVGILLGRTSMPRRFRCLPPSPPPACWRSPSFWRRDRERASAQGLIDHREPSERILLPCDRHRRRR